MMAIMCCVQRTPSVAPLSQERIVAIALSLTRQDGEPPGMRALAAELEVTPGALYRHLTNQQQLVALMINDAMERVEMPEPAEQADPWERIRVYVRSLMGILDTYPGLDRLIVDYGDSSPAARLRQRWLVRQLQSAGLARADAVKAYGVLDMYWLGSRQRERRTRATFYFGLDRLLDGLREFATKF
jgi:AcrR family transcriptional regulator